MLYSFEFGTGTLRDIEASCKYDIRYIYLMEQQPIHLAFGTFINEYIVPNAEMFFSTITKEVLKECKMDLVEAFIDSTKLKQTLTNTRLYGSRQHDITNYVTRLEIY